MRIDLSTCALRSYRAEDAVTLAREGNDRRIWRNMSDGFPSPFTIEAATRIIDRATRTAPESWFAIAVEDVAVGGIGYTPRDGAERGGAEIAYWLSPGFWGRGIMTEAVTALTGHAFDRDGGLRRLFALPYAWNPASHRVLAKAGYALEGRLRQSIIKDGLVTDQLLYARLRDDIRPGAPAPLETP